MSSKHRDLLVTNALAILLGLAASGLLLLFLGKNPVTTMLTLFGSLFRDRYTFADIFVKATPLMFMALAFGLPFQANLYNIGAQGQFYIGSVTAVGLSLLLMDNIPGPLVLVVVALASMVAGGLWGGLIGWLKARFNANEFLVSMMSTYVALNFMNYMLRTFLMETKGEYPQTDPLVKSAWLPIFVPGTRLHIGFILAVLACIGVWVLLYRTPLGFRIRAVGQNKDAAELAGINYKRLYVMTFFIAGALGAMGGFTEVNGVQHMLVQGFNPGVGAAGIGIAILANGHPIGMIFAAILFGALNVGGTIMGQLSGVPSSINDLMLGFVMLFVILAYFVRERLEDRREKARLKKAASI
ncbi:MAG: ABC transporter permease [Candidatus Promineofilum sp.]|nr:ABC transporter permease [Promineifilum sp.]